MKESLELQFHHVGYATRSIDAEWTLYQKLGYEREGAIFEDHTQKIRGLFIVKDGFRLELLEPLGEKSPLESVIKRDIKMYHQAFLTTNLEKSIEDLRAMGGLLFVQPVPAVAFGNRRICFLMMPNRDMFELIEKP